MKAEYARALGTKKKKTARTPKTTSASTKAKRDKALGHFGGQVFTVGDWAAIKDIVDEIMVCDISHHLCIFHFVICFIYYFFDASNNLNQPLKYLTKRMEGDAPTGSIVLYEYHKLKTKLIERQAGLSDDDTLKPMIDAMLKRTTKYMNEAMACDSLVLAAVLNPALRLGFFDIAYGKGSKESKRAASVFRSACEARRAELNKKKDSALPDLTKPGTSSKPKATPAIFQLYSTANKANDLDEIEKYLQGVHPMVFYDKTSKDVEVEDDIIEPELVLSWWKVRPFIYTFSLILHIIY